MPPSRLKPLRRPAAIGLGVLCGCQPAPPIKVAFIGGLSGRVSELAIDGRSGVQRAVETLDDRSGPRYERRVHDDAQSVEPGAEQIADAAVLRGLLSAALMGDWYNRTCSKSVASKFDARFQPLGGAPIEGSLALQALDLDRRSPRDVLRAPGTWPGLQQPIVLDHFGDGINRFHLGEVRNGRFAMLAT